MSEDKHILVIGFGNTLRGDDALGRVACERLRSLVDPKSVKIIDQQAPTPELAAKVAAAASVIFLDASVDGPEDSVVTRRLPVTEHGQSTAHSLDVRTVLGLAHHLYDRQPTAFLVSFRGKSFGLSDKMTPDALAACDAIVEQTLELVRPEKHSDRRVATLARAWTRVENRGDSAHPLSGDGGYDTFSDNA